jgi:hypothetical protein
MQLKKKLAGAGIAGLLAFVVAHFVKPRHEEGGEAYKYEFATVRVQYTPGEIYSVQNKHGYGIVKILAVDPDIVHIRLYKNTFPERPNRIDPSTLSLGKITDPNGFGIGHLPISQSEFSSWDPVLIAQSKVTPDELEGYEEWKKDHGGVFGK